MPNEARQHVHIYGVSASPLSAGAKASSAGGDVRASRFEMSFEQAFEGLEFLPRMFIELDGSFVWSGQTEAGRWQIDGMLYDRDARLQRVELAGHRPRQQWAQLLNVFGQPLDTLTVHCLQEQRFIDTAEFLERAF